MDSTATPPWPIIYSAAYLVIKTKNSTYLWSVYSSNSDFECVSGTFQDHNLSKAEAPEMLRKMVRFVMGYSVKKEQYQQYFDPEVRLEKANRSLQHNVGKTVSIFGIKMTEVQEIYFTFSPRVS